MSREEQETQAFNRMSDYRIIKGLYKRHNVGVAYTLTIVSWTVSLWLVIGRL